jgi:multidrug efflux pump subunit AcrA (membrane-fusion protein)
MLLKYKFNCLKNVSRIPYVAKLLAYFVVIGFVIATLVMAFVPWVQTSYCTGVVMAVDPSKRVQPITSLNSGRIKQWYVQDGSFVKKFDPIVEIIDNDPDFLERVKNELLIAENSVKIAEETFKVAEFNYLRQKNLHEHGVAARKEFEKAQIAYKEKQLSLASERQKLLQIQSKFFKQNTQKILAPEDGFVSDLISSGSTRSVKVGDILANFVPKTNDLMLELYADTNDIPLIHSGRKVRIQFEGWPAMQFSGWPSISFGTFGGIVSFVSPSISHQNNKVRVLVMPDPDYFVRWPSSDYLKQNANVKAYITLDTVTVGYEIWRKLNGFPPKLDKQPEHVEKSYLNK